MVQDSPCLKIDEIDRVDQGAGHADAVMQLHRLQCQRAVVIITVQDVVHGRAVKDGVAVVDDIFQGGLVHVVGLGDGVILHALQGVAVVFVHEQEQDDDEQEEDDTGGKQIGVEDFLIKKAAPVFLFHCLDDMLEVHGNGSFGFGMGYVF